MKDKKLLVYAAVAVLAILVIGPYTGLFSFTPFGLYGYNFVDVGLNSTMVGEGEDLQVDYDIVKKLAEDYWKSHFHTWVWIDGNPVKYGKFDVTGEDRASDFYTTNKLVIPNNLSTGTHTMKVKVFVSEMFSTDYNKWRIILPEEIPWVLNGNDVVIDRMTYTSRFAEMGLTKFFDDKWELCDVVLATSDSGYFTGSFKCTEDDMFIISERLVPESNWLEKDFEQTFFVGSVGDLMSQTELLESLGATSAERAEYIAQLQLSLEEQLDYIVILDLSVQETAELIGELELNLDEKAYLVSQLTVTTDEQAELISAMELSFADQGEIISQLKNTVEDDAVLIGSLTDENDEQQEIIENLDRTVIEQQEIIEALKTSVLEDQEIVGLPPEVDDGRSPVKAIFVGIVVLFGLYLLFEAGGSRGLIQKKRGGKKR